MNLKHEIGLCHRVSNLHGMALPGVAIVLLRFYSKKGEENLFIWDTEEPWGLTAEREGMYGDLFVRPHGWLQGRSNDKNGLW